MNIYLKKKTFIKLYTPIVSDRSTQIRKKKHYDVINDSLYFFIHFPKIESLYTKRHTHRSFYVYDIYNESVLFKFIILS